MPTTTVDIEQLSEASLRSALYDRIYNIADRLCKKYNPCNIRIKDNKVLCTCKLHTKYRQKALCCERIDGTNCEYWSDGCTVKCLPCKLFTCYAIKYGTKNYSCDINKKYKVLINRLKWLRNITTKYGIYTYAFFHNKSEVLNISEKKRKAGYENS